MEKIPVPTASEKSEIYLLFSELFARELTVENIENLANLINEGVLKLAKMPLMRPMIDAISLMAENPKETERELAAAYAFLFLGVGGRNSVPPYESAYGSSEGRLCQEPFSAMQRELEQLDMHIVQDFPEPPDHISIELEVASILAARQDQPKHFEAFLEARLKGWIGEFATRCARSDRHGFYAALAGAVAGFVELDLNQFSEAA